MEKGQTTTKARFRKRKDIRNMVTMAIMNEAYSFNKPPQLIGNFDATQFIITGNSEELFVTIKKSNMDDITDIEIENQPLSSVTDAKLSQAVKWMMLANANANGNLSVDVFLLSDPSMESDELSFYQISGLSHSTDLKSFGYLCFTKKRAGNLIFFSWYICHSNPIRQRMSIITFNRIGR